MAFPKPAIATPLLIILIISLPALHLCQADEQIPIGGGSDDDQGPAVTYGDVQYAKMDCGGACKARCRLASRHKMCIRACGTCCSRCNCVPPGTSGNRDVCPCYARMTTHGGRLKCP
ncbi:unnamed protein product [Linum tenue]|uniref:Uncharacterized protein n=1 Tax=Linum tenue TaxID=586396 RepID=A0AAV0HCH4_9ROSI|nr:unnamed protein product [Linum tenue]